MLATVSAKAETTEHVYGIVKQHDGFLNVYSEVEKGTTFRVYFPSSTGRVSQREPNIATISVTGSETILVAEDHEGIRCQQDGGAVRQVIPPASDRSRENWTGRRMGS
jgi:hypothetical protein